MIKHEDTNGGALDKPGMHIDGKAEDPGQHLLEAKCRVCHKMFPTSQLHDGVCPRCEIGPTR